jgi:hypothetical protein
MKRRRRVIKVMFTLVIVIGSALLLYMMDDGFGISWIYNALRNWKQFGLFTLKGMLVINPGGVEATTNPAIYKGPSPVYLYLVYLVMKLFAWTGFNALLFHILLAFSVFLAIYSLLGRNALAYIIATTIILCPGYIIYQKFLDPNSIPILLSLPYVAFVFFLLKRKRLSFSFISALFALTFGFAALNWSTVLIFIPYALLLLGTPNLNRRAVIIFIVLSSISHLLITIISVFGRNSLPSVNNTANIYQFFSNYTWGKARYYWDYNLRNKPLLMFCIANIVGLLPLLLVYGYFLIKCIRLGIKIPLMTILIIAAAILNVFILKNYFLANQWMATQLFTVSLIFSLVLICSRANKKMAGINKNISQRFFLFIPIIALLCFVYSLTIVAWWRAHHESEVTLIRLVRNHTRRSDTIMVLNADTNIARSFERDLAKLSCLLDRRVVVVETTSALAGENNQVFLLSSLVLGAPWHLIANENCHRLNYYSLFKKADGWYNRTFIKRKGNYLIKPADSYFLYIQK